MANSFSRSLVSIVALVAASQLVCAQDQQQSSSSFGLTSIPGIQTANGILASSADGMRRYLAQDGPIQPAITAIGGLPMRGVEYLNSGINSVSNGLGSSAQMFKRNSGSSEIRMPGRATLGSMMPGPLQGVGNLMNSGIEAKNYFIANQGQRGVDAANRLGDMMSNALPPAQQNQIRTRRDVSMQQDSMDAAATGNMMSSAHGAMQKGMSDIKGQLQQSLGGMMGRMQQMSGLGQNVRSQVQGIGRTVSSGLQRSASALHETGEKVVSQLQGGMKQNGQSMSGVLGSFQGSMGNMGQNIQKNLQGVVQHAQNTAMQLQGHLQQAMSGPMNMLSNLGSSLGGMMNKGGSMSGGGGGSSKQSGGRY